MDPKTVKRLNLKTAAWLEPLPVGIGEDTVR
jgi:hypothetical protein